MNAYEWVLFLVAAAVTSSAATGVGLDEVFVVTVAAIFDLVA